LGSLSQGVTVDTGFSMPSLVRLAFDLRSVTPSAITASTLPTVTRGAVTPWGDVLFVTGPHAHALPSEVFGSELRSPSAPPPAPSPQPDTVLAAPLPASGGSVSASGPTANRSSSFDPTPCAPG
jgi:hypothetical protein